MLIVEGPSKHERVQAAIEERPPLRRRALGGLVETAKYGWPARREVGAAGVVCTRTRRGREAELVALVRLFIFPFVLGCRVV